MSKFKVSDFSHFVLHLRFEAFALGLLMLVLAYHNDYSAWWLLWLFIIFDIGMLGYVVGPKFGSITYNVTHNATLPTLLITHGIYTNNTLTAFIGIAWTFHIAIDRCLGYGLKHKHSFKHTHLGKIGQ